MPSLSRRVRLDRPAAETDESRCHLGRDGDVHNAAVLLVALAPGAAGQADPCTRSPSRLVSSLRIIPSGKWADAAPWKASRTMLPGGCRSPTPSGSLLNDARNRVLDVDARAWQDSSSGRSAASRLTKPEPGIHKSPRERRGLRLPHVLLDQVGQQAGHEVDHPGMAHDLNADSQGAEDCRHELLNDWPRILALLEAVMSRAKRARSCWSSCHAPSRASCSAPKSIAADCPS